REECRALLREQLVPPVRHAADLVLAWCWALPSAPAALAGRAGLPEGVLESLTVLRAALAGAEGRALRVTAGAVVQRAEEEGYAWKEVAPRTPFEDSMTREF